MENKNRNLSSVVPKKFEDVKESISEVIKKYASTNVVEILETF